MAADPNHVILTGENPFIRLSATDGGPQTTNASYWRIITCPAGPGHVLYLKSELTENSWRIYSDNIAMARWLQGTVQGMLNAETADTSIPVIDAEFSKTGDPRYFWTENLVTHDEAISLTWYDIGEPLLIHTNPGEGGRKYGVCTLLIPALGARLTRNGVEAAGKPWPMHARAARSAPARSPSRKAGPRRGSGEWRRRLRGGQGGIARDGPAQAGERSAGDEPPHGPPRHRIAIEPGDAIW